MKSKQELEQEIRNLQSQLEIIKNEETKAKEREKESRQREANEKIAGKLKLIDALLTECEEIAREAGVEFSWDGPGYGMEVWFADGEWTASS